MPQTSAVALRNSFPKLPVQRREYRWVSAMARLTDPTADLPTAQVRFSGWAWTTGNAGELKEGRPLLGAPRTDPNAPSSGIRLLPWMLDGERTFGHGWRIRGNGNHAAAIFVIRSHVMPSFWLRKKRSRFDRFCSWDHQSAFISPYCSWM